MGVDLIANEKIMNYSEIKCNKKNAIIQKKLHLKKMHRRCIFLLTRNASRAGRRPLLVKEKNFPSGSFFLKYFKKEC